MQWMAHGEAKNSQGRQLAWEATSTLREASQARMRRESFNNLSEFTVALPYCRLLHGRGE